MFDLDSDNPLQWSLLTIHNVELKRVVELKSHSLTFDLI
jgi:hypothetical protein